MIRRIRLGVVLLMKRRVRLGLLLLLSVAIAPPALHAQRPAAVATLELPLAKPEGLLSHQLTHVFSSFSRGKPPGCATIPVPTTVTLPPVTRGE
jgi:hypothetical protein